MSRNPDENAENEFGNWEIIPPDFAVRGVQSYRLRQSGIAIAVRPTGAAYTQSARI